MHNGISNSGLSAILKRKIVNYGSVLSDSLIGQFRCCPYTRPLSKMKIYLPIILILLSLLSCGHNENWEEFKGKNLPDSKEGYEVLKFGDQSNIYLGGSRSIAKGKKDHQNQFEDLCILYESSDFGRTWEKLPFPKMKGEISLIDIDGKNIVVVNQLVMNDSSQILLSEDQGRNWTKLFNYHDDNYIQSIRIDTDKNIRFVARERNGIQKVLSLTESKIDTIILPKGVRNVQLTDNGFIGISYSPDSSKLLEYDRIGTVKSLTKIDLEKPYDLSKQTDKGDILFYDSYSTADILLLRDGQFKNIELEGFTNYSVVEPYIEDSLILINGFHDDDDAFLGVIHTFLVSEDFGQTWNEEEIPSSMITEPGDLKEGRFLTYAGMGRFQKRK